MFQFAVESREAGDLIGDRAPKVDGQEPYRAGIGFTLAREHQGKGFASEPVSRLLHCAFDIPGLHRIVALVDCKNRPSRDLLGRIGMRPEGRFPEDVWFRGEWSDEHLYAVLKHEWLRMRTEKPQ